MIHLVLCFLFYFVCKRAKSMPYFLNQHVASFLDAYLGLISWCLELLYFCLLFVAFCFCCFLFFFPFNFYFCVCLFALTAFVFFTTVILRFSELIVLNFNNIITCMLFELSLLYFLLCVFRLVFDLYQLCVLLFFGSVGMVQYL